MIINQVFSAAQEIFLTNEQICKVHPDGDIYYYSGQGTTPARLINPSNSNKVRTCPYSQNTDKPAEVVLILLTRMEICNYAAMEGRWTWVT